ncbi:MAG TPA: phospholipid carrier-dependent glycosyltransferase [Chloroflexota bacterium]|nr:phospholipid carrier-dependent glycosyltransferase [Chloroflexota bacterium]
MALIARLWQIDLTRFFNDQVDHIQSAASFVQTGHIPLSSGFTFAVGTTGAVIRIPPLVTYLLALPALISLNPIWLSACVAMLDALAAPLVYLIALKVSGRASPALVAGILYALSPTAIVFGRLIWNPDFVPLFAAVALLGLVEFSQPAHSWSLAASLFAIGCAAELHVVNGIFLPLWLAVAWSGRRKLRYRPLLAAAVALLVTLAPYLMLEVQSGWSDVLNLARYLTLPKAFDWAVIDAVGAMAGDTAYRRLLATAGDALAPFTYDPLTWLLIGLTVVGLLASRRRDRRARLIVAAWLLLPIAGQLRHSGAVVSHYLLATLPAIAMLQGLGLEEIWRVMAMAWRRIFAGRGQHLLAAGSALLVCGWLASDDGQLQATVAANARQVEYGMPLRYSMEAADLVRSRAGEQPLYLAVPFLYNKTVPYLAGRSQPYQWYWDRSVFVFPQTSAWYLAQSDSFGFDFLTRAFGPAQATVANVAGTPEFGLFQLPDGAARQLSSPANFIQDEATDGPARLEGILPDTLMAGQSSRVTLLWRIEDAAAMPQHLSEFAHLTDQSGSTISTDPDLYDVREPWRNADEVASAFDLNVAPQTPTGGYWLETGFYDTFSRQPLGKPVRIGPLKVMGVAPFAPPTSQPLATLGEGQIALLRADWQGQDVAIDWQALQKPRASYTVFVHAVDGSDKLAGQWDGLPRQGSYPTSLWDAGEVVHDVYPLGVGPAPSLHLEIGLYTQPDVQRLPVRQSGSSTASDHVTIGAPLPR